MIGSISIIVLTILLIPCLAFSQTYTVKSGDNLWRISKKFQVSVDEIKRANNLRDNRLQVGMKLEIPDRASNTVQTKRDGRSKKQEPIYHTVKRGENLFRIAKKYNISVDELKRLNNLTDNRVSVGQKLIVKGQPRPVENPSSNEQEPTQNTLASLNKSTEFDNKKEEIEQIASSEDISQLSIVDRILLFAKKMLHLPYRFGGNSFSGLDCSFFVKKVYSLVGIDLPRSAREQFALGIPVSKDELMPGDLVFFRTYAKFPSHVGIYLGDNLFIHASSKSKKVVIDSLDTPYYVKRYIGAKRILDNAEQETIDKILRDLKGKDS